MNNSQKIVQRDGPSSASIILTRCPSRTSELFFGCPLSLFPTIHYIHTVLLSANIIIVDIDYQLLSLAASSPIHPLSELKSIPFIEWHFITFGISPKYEARPPTPQRKAMPPTPLWVLPAILDYRRYKIEVCWTIRHRPGLPHHHLLLLLVPPLPCALVPIYMQRVGNMSKK